jgi:DNA mismatch endonuclease (patch repair protein)
MSWATTPGRRRIMQGNRSRDTGPELAVRRSVHALGMRYRVSVRPLPQVPRTADLVFPRLRIAVFVDGCFWHSCPIHTPAPTKNIEYWTAKLAANRRRDRETSEILTNAGWLVVRFWEHEDPDRVARTIETAVGERRSSSFR